MQIKTTEKSGITYLSTLSMYKAIGLYSHQKLTDRIGRIGLEMETIEDFGTVLSLENALAILQAYQANSEGERLIRVNELIEECTQAANLGELELGELKPKGITHENTDTQKITPESQSMAKSNITQTKVKTKLSKPQKSTRLTQKSSKHTRLKRTNLFLHYLTELTTLLRTEQFIFLVLFGAIAIQISHTAHLYHRASVHLTPSAGWFGAYIFGTVTELTALLLTIHDGKKNKLLIFAALTFWVNTLYYDVLKGVADISPEVMQFLNKMTLSGIIAFVLYAYTDLFTGWVGRR